METPVDKKSLRAHFQRLRANIPEQERSIIDARIAAGVIALPAFQRADALFIYLSMGTEVETRNIIRAAWQDGKIVALPRCIPASRLMTWHRVETLDSLVKSPFGVEEPPDDAATLVTPDAFCTPLAVVPGLTFDSQGYRLGYGGGFYDTFLEAHKLATVGLCRECQLSVRVTFLDKHDLPVQAVVTENRMLTARA